MAHANENQGDGNTGRDGDEIALERIAAEREARTGKLDLGGLGLSRLPEELFELEWLETLVLGGYPHSAPSRNRINAEIVALPKLPQLALLDCSWTDLVDLTPLDGLTALTSFECSGTDVSDLWPIAGLRALNSLDCSRTRVSDLAPIAGLTALTSIDCSRTRVSDLAPISGLAVLTSLDFWETQVSDLSPIAGLTALTSLDCSTTRVSELSPIAGLTALTSLECWDTQVSDLSPIAGLTALTSLSCMYTQVSDLTPLKQLTELRRVQFTGTNVRVLPPELVNAPRLKTLEISPCPALASIPAEVVSKYPNDNCLPRLRAHLADVAAGAEPFRDIKVIVLGNGRIGKTQLCRRLRGLDFEPDADSTHGIGVTTAELAMAEGAPALLNLWDFGGQDLYHGTHALFMRTRAIFVVVWTPDSEQGAHAHGDRLFQNRPLGYWFDYVRHLGGERSPLLVVQNQCDGGLGERPNLPDSPALQALCADGRLFRALGYSAKDQSGQQGLLEALRQAVMALRRLQGQPLMGTNRLQVRDQLRAWRDADSALPDTAERRHRLLPFADFRSLCEQHGVHDPAGFAEVLHRSGELWYQPGHFGDRMILDQSWAMREIYALFTREDGVYDILRGPGLAGRFTRPLLDRLLWGRPTAYRDPLTAADQRVLLGLMEQSGICFAHRRRHDDRDATEYVAPDLLPARDRLARGIANRWDARTGQVQEAAFVLPLLTPAIARTVLSALGDLAGADADYWRYGLSLYDARTGSAAEINEQPDAQGHGGRLGLRVKGEQAGALLETLAERIAELNESQGWAGRLERAAAGAPDGVGSEAASAPEPATRMPRTVAHGTREAVPLLPTPPPPTTPDQPEVYVSYNWRRDEQSPLVEGLCDALSRRDGIRVIRERDIMHWGDSIRRFMQQLAAGRCVLVILSAEYLNSPFCMTELHGIWRAAGERDGAFRRRIVPLIQDDVRLRSLPNRVAHLEHWRQECERLDALLCNYSMTEALRLLGQDGVAEWQAITGFHQDIVKMLTVANDMLIPRQPELLAADDFAAVRELIRERIA